MVSTLLWGIDFIIGSLVALPCRMPFKHLRSAKVMTHQYQNNYLLSRISGLAFDIMVVAGIAGINIEGLSGSWVPFILMAIAGDIVTFYYLYWLYKKLYPNNFYEGLLPMYGMLTGTISSGVLRLRELDSEVKTPASNNLITGSSFGIPFASQCSYTSVSPKSDLMTWVALGLVIIYLAALLFFDLRVGKKRENK